MNNGQRWRITAVVVLSLFMAALDNSIVSVTLPQMQEAFHVTYQTITWVATAYFLAQAAVIPVVGYVSDRLGTTRVFLVALALFTLGSLLCALAPSSAALIAFRAFQGIGGGALLPVTFTMIYRLFSPTERGGVTAVISIAVIIAPAFGPTIGGWLSTSFDWSAIFTLNLPIGIVALVLGMLVLPRDETEREQQRAAKGSSGKRRFDVPGLLLSMVGFTALVYGASEASSQSWSNPGVLASFLLGALALVGFVLTELVVSDPVMEIRLFQNYTFTIANVLMWMASAVVFGCVFLLPFFFEHVQGQSALTAGEILIGEGLAAGIGVLLSGIFYNRVGPRALAVIGLLLVIAAMYGLTRLTVETTGNALQIWLILFGLGLGCLNPPLQTLAMSVVSHQATAKASSLVNAMRQVAGAIGVAVLTTYLTRQTTTHAIQLHHASGIVAICARTAGSPFNQALVRACVEKYATTNGLIDTFWAILFASVACLILAMLVGRDPAIEAYKRARVRGEEQPLQSGPTMSEETESISSLGKRTSFD